MPSRELEQIDEHYAMLQKAKSKDQLEIRNNNIRDKYIMMAGAQQILAGGRHDKDRIIMDRYKRESQESRYEHLSQKHHS